MVNSNQLLKVANKGASIRNAGFLTGIHALPVEIKTKLDELLLLRYSPEKALSILEREYPNTNFPSKSAVYSYKNKYLPNSLTNVRHLSHLAESIDVEKMNTASLFISHLRRFIAIDLNVLQDRWYNSLEHGLDKDEKKVNERGRLYIDGIKLGMDMLLKLNVSLDVKPIIEIEAQVKSEKEETDFEKKRKFVLYAKYCYERQQLGEKLNNIDTKIAKMYESRGKVDLHHVESIFKQMQENNLNKAT